MTPLSTRRSRDNVSAGDAKRQKAVEQALQNAVNQSAGLVCDAATERAAICSRRGGDDGRQMQRLIGLLVA